MPKLRESYDYKRMIKDRAEYRRLGRVKQRLKQEKFKDRRATHQLKLVPEKNKGDDVNGKRNLPSSVQTDAEETEERG